MNTTTKYILIIILAFSISTTSNAQWSAVGTGMDTISSFSGPMAMVVWQNDLYVGGDFWHAGGISASNIAKWNGTSWSSIDNSSGVGGTPYAMIVYNNKLCIAGRLNKVGSCFHIVQWDGANWFAMGSNGGLGGNWQSEVHALAIYKNELYAGGIFQTADGNTCNNIAKWNGAQWVSVGSGMGGGITNSYVSSLEVYNGELYAGGGFTTAGGITCNYIAKWNGSTWSSVGGGTDSDVYALKNINNELYVGGVFLNAGTSSAKSIAKWNGTNWSSLGSGADFFVTELASYNGEAYIGGTYTWTGSSHISKWNGTSWSSPGSGVDNHVHSLEVYNNELYVGGEFQSAGGITAYRIAKWSVVGAGTHENATSSAVNVFPNPTINKFKIESEGEPIKAISIYNCLGEKVKAVTLLNQVPTYEMDLSEFILGIYFYEIVSSKNDISTGRIVKCQ